MFVLMFNPRRFFEGIAKTIHLSPVLIAVRWIGTASLVTLPLWLKGAVPFSPPWLPIPEETYYFWQLVFILPYGVLITFLLTGLTLLICKGGGRPSTRFRAALAVVSYSLFLPWVACLVWDIFLILSGNWSLAWAAPFHSAAVIAEGLLYAYGVRKVFSASWTRAVLIAVINSIVFIGLSALIVR
ncbi:hypothetical protein GF359_01075 [candidate division WOR-3 bacterium]|uniref:Yip1 domain-containing protein n=1 Tax=candidate division WOR-3 bacterium TaxID=2052148 RepID=A0A9D5K9I8_UNCW3|nr:hypothetical protein [candidate division WOR-3 bacterium]MBD3363786.1 hypothetical protein [candidate division WOR-3 bacterium]